MNLIMNHIWLDIFVGASGMSIASFMGWIVKFVMRVDARLTRIETLLRLTDNED